MSNPFIFYEIEPIINKDIYKALSMNDDPPTLYSLMESKINFDSETKTKIEDLPSAFRSTLFDFEYPLDNQYREHFEETFLTHYMFRRIGFDTFLSFKLHLKVKLNSIMEKYNKMLEGFDSLDFLGTTETHVRDYTLDRDTTNNNTITSGAAGSLETINKFSDTPQDDLTNVNNDTYLTSYEKNNQSSSSNSNSVNSGTTSEDSSIDETITIHRGDSIDEYKKFLNIANNVYEQIFKECDSLFYLIY